MIEENKWHFKPEDSIDGGKDLEEPIENELDPQNNNFPSPKIRVLFLTVDPDIQGPIPKIDRLLLPALEDLGCDFTTNFWGRHSENETIFQKMVGRLFDLFNAIRKLIRIKPDILYIATTLDEYSLARDIPLLILARFFSARKVLMMHGSQTSFLEQPGHKLFKFLTKILIQFSDAILLLSTEELQDWTHFAPFGKYFVVSNPCELKNKNELDRSNKRNLKPLHPTILFVGRLVRAKGIFDLIEAMPTILKKIDCNLLIAGEGDCKEEIQHRINEAYLGHSISLLGYLDPVSLADIYRLSTIFILPTFDHEGFPTVIAEAMSFGLPIITTAIRGTRDYLVDGINTLFVPPKSPQAIADSVIRLLVDPDLCLRMERANLMKVQDFRPERVARRYMEGHVWPQELWVDWTLNHAEVLNKVGI